LADNWNDHPSIKCIGGWRFPNPWGVPLNHPCFSHGIFHSKSSSITWSPIYGTVQ
jgi:hypothetical protein